MTFTSEQYGIVESFTIGQKVRCTYYNEGVKPSYKRKFLHWLIDRPFRPVKLGVIVGDAGIHPFYLAQHGTDTEQYLFVRFKEYIFPKAIPIGCIKDALQAAKDLKEFLEESRSRIGQPGFSYESFTALSKDMDEAFNFTL